MFEFEFEGLGMKGRCQFGESKILVNLATPTPVKMVNFCVSVVVNVANRHNFLGGSVFPVPQPKGFGGGIKPKKKNQRPSARFCCLWRQKSYLGGSILMYINFLPGGTVFCLGGGGISPPWACMGSVTTLTAPLINLPN